MPNYKAMSLKTINLAIDNEVREIEYLNAKIEECGDEKCNRLLKIGYLRKERIRKHKNNKM